MFLTDNDILDRIADVLQAASRSALPSQWASTIVPDGHRRAYNEIVSALASRGYTLSQITSWDRGTEFEADLGVWASLVKGASLANVTPTLLEMYDRREELRGNPAKGVPAVVVTISGAFVDPAGTAGQVVVGSDDTSGDTFVFPWQSDDPFPPGQSGQDLKW